MRRTIIACVLTALAVGTGTATAAKLITSKDIADGTIQTRDIGKDQVTLNRLSPGVRGILAQAGTPGANGVNGVNGKDGVNGVNGKDGTQGVPGPTGATGPQGTPGAPGTDGTNGGLPTGFFVTNKSVGLTKSGVDFGPYTDGGTAGGSLYYNGLNGKTLSDITGLAYTVEHSSTNASPIGVPYLRVFLNGDQDDVIFDPTQCVTTVPTENTPNTFDVTGGDVRYDDDSCDGVAPDQQSWANVLAAHGTDVISGVYVSTGFTGGQDLRAKLTDLSVNGQAFTFGG
jgi:Collagen triple helix repeat (20 copies)